MRYFIGFMVTIGLLIFLIVLLFRGGDEAPKTATTNRPLSSYAAAGEVSMVIDGPVNADSQHDMVRISVDRQNVIFEHLRGYRGDVVKMASYPNNEAAFTTFLRALAVSGYTNGDTDKSLRDERGQCPQGTRYIFELREGVREIQRFWATTCGNPKTYLGNANVTAELFQAQVPDYSQLIDNIKL